MELLNPLRQLLRRRRVLLLGMVLCGALGVAASGYLPVGPFASPERRSAVSTAEIQIDTVHPLAADLRASTATIAEQAAMLGERLAGDDTRGLIAARAGVRSRDLAILSSRTAIIGRSNPLARAAVEGVRLGADARPADREQRPPIRRSSRSWPPRPTAPQRRDSPPPRRGRSASSSRRRPTPSGSGSRSRRCLLAEDGYGRLRRSASGDRRASSR